MVSLGITGRLQSSMLEQFELVNVKEPAKISIGEKRKILRIHSVNHLPGRHASAAASDFLPPECKRLPRSYVKFCTTSPPTARRVIDISPHTYKEHELVVLQTPVAARHTHKRIQGADLRSGDSRIRAYTRSARRRLEAAMAEVNSGRWLRRRGRKSLSIISQLLAAFCSRLGLPEDGAGGMWRLNEEKLGGA